MVKLTVSLYKIRDCSTHSRPVPSAARAVTATAWFDAEVATRVTVAMTRMTRMDHMVNAVPTEGAK